MGAELWSYGNCDSLERIHLKFLKYLFNLKGFEGRIWDLIVSVPDHCLSFYFAYQSSCGCAVWWP